MTSSLTGLVAQCHEETKSLGTAANENGHPIWLFAGSEEGGQRAARILSIIETCKLSGIESEAYIADIMQKIADDWPASRWDELLPWNWARKSDTMIDQAA